MCTKHMGVRLIGMANKISYLGRLWALSNDSRHNEAVAQMPRSPDLAIFVLTTDRQTLKPITLPLLHMCARGVIKYSHYGPLSILFYLN
jgi:hypothetical protein